MIIAIATWTSTLPNAVQMTPAFSGFSLVLMVFGALWLCLWQTRWRLFGWVGVGLGLALMPLYSLPDVYITGTAKNIAVRGPDGLLVVAKARREKYSVGKWLNRDGDQVTAKEAARRKGFRCDDHGCIFTLEDGRLLGFAEDFQAVEEDCRRVDILVATVPIRQNCPKPVVKIDKFDLWRNGAYAITFLPGDFLVENAAGQRGDRPWVRKRPRRKSYDTKR